MGFVLSVSVQTQRLRHFCRLVSVVLREQLYQMLFAKHISVSIPYSNNIMTTINNCNFMRKCKFPDSHFG